MGRGRVPGPSSVQPVGEERAPGPSSIQLAGQEGASRGHGVRLAWQVKGSQSCRPAGIQGEGLQNSRCTRGRL